MIKTYHNRKDESSKRMQLRTLCVRIVVVWDGNINMGEPHIYRLTHNYFGGIDEKVFGQSKGNYDQEAGHPARSFG
jgi:hypothetical protein